MESKIKGTRRYFVALIAGVALPLSAAGHAQDTRSEEALAPESQMTLRKDVRTREYQGKAIEGEERSVARGDSLWRILIQEKGLPEKRFHSYLVVIRGLNPQLKNLNILRVGDAIFIPLRPDEALPAAAARSRAAAVARTPRAGNETIDYRVKSGEHLYQILRQELGLRDEKELARYYALTKDLNPDRKEWNILVEGDTIRLPTTGLVRESARQPEGAPTIARRATDTAATLTGQENPPPRAVPSEPQTAPTIPAISPPSQSAPPPQPVAEEAPAATAVQTVAEPAPTMVVETAPAAPPAPPIVPTAPPVDMDYARRLPATQGMSLLASVVDNVGAQMQSTGEEVVTVKGGAVRFDKSSYPVVYSPKVNQKVVLDPGGNIPASLRRELGDPDVGAPVVSMNAGTSLQEAVGQLLAGLGYQTLPNDRPVVIHEAGIAYEAKGNWMALAPEESNQPQQILVINLSDRASTVPQYLVDRLGSKGLQIRDIVVPSPVSQSIKTGAPEPQENAGQTQMLPPDRKDMIDALLIAYGVPFGVGETISVKLGDGLSLETRADRVFESRGNKVALFFRRNEPGVKKALQEREGLRIVEMDLSSLASREVIEKLLAELGEPAIYREHRFPAAGGAARDRLVVTAWGLLDSKHSRFLTDREIPPSLNRFFFDKGLQVIQFQ